MAGESDQSSYNTRTHLVAGLHRVHCSLRASLPPSTSRMPELTSECSPYTYVSGIKRRHRLIRTQSDLLAGLRGAEDGADPRLRRPKRPHRPRQGRPDALADASLRRLRRGRVRFQRQPHPPDRGRAERRADRRRQDPRRDGGRGRGRGRQGQGRSCERDGQGDVEERWPKGVHEGPGRTFDLHGASPSRRVGTER